jgi:hypothetical protein
MKHIGYEPPKRLKPPSASLSKLSGKMHKLIELMTSGATEESVRAFTRKIRSVDAEGNTITIEKPIEPGEPLDLRTACLFGRIRVRQGKDLMRAPLFVAELNKALKAQRDSARPRALATVVSLMDDEGDNSAATKKVRLAASQTILGEEGDGKRNGVTVVNNLGVQVTSPGYMVRVPQQDASAYAVPGARTIQGEGQFWANQQGKAWPGPSSRSPDAESEEQPE